MDLRMRSIANVRIFHAATMAMPVDIFINDQEAITDLRYGEVTDYLPLEQGKYNIKVYGGNNGNLLYNQTIQIDGDQYITLSAISESGKLNLIVLNDMRGLRIDHSQYREEAMIKTVKDESGNLVNVLVNKAGTVIEDAVDDLGNTMVYAGDSIKRVIDRLGNTYEVVVAQSGKVIGNVINGLDYVVDGFVNRIGNTIKKSVNQFGNTVELVVDGFGQTMGWVVDELSNIIEDTEDDVSNFATGSSKQYVDLEQEPELQSLIPDYATTRTPKESNAFVRFVHLSPDAPAVDITLPDGTKLFVDTAYKQVTNYIPVEAGTFDLQVRPTRTNQVALSVEDVSFEAGNMYSVYAIGLLKGKPSLNAVVLEDQNREF